MSVTMSFPGPFPEAAAFLLASQLSENELALGTRMAVAEICRSRGGSSSKTVWKGRKTWVNNGSNYTVVLGK